MKRLLPSFTMLILTIMIGLCMTGCGSDHRKEGENHSDVAASDSSDVSQGSAEGIMDHETDIDTSISSGYYLSLGVLDENVVRNGSKRDESEVSVVDKKVVFPQGEIRAIGIESWSRKEQAYNPGKSEITKYIDALESAEMIDDVPEGVSEAMTGIVTHILCINSHGEFRTVAVTNLGKGYHAIYVEKDDVKDFSKGVSISSAAGKKYDQVFLRSHRAEKIIKKWIQWENDGKNGFESIQSAILIDGWEDDSIELTKEQLKSLKKCLEADKKITDAPCGSENYFECTQEDGSKFHFSISADGDCISTDRHVYALDYPDNEALAELIKKWR